MVLLGLKQDCKYAEIYEKASLKLKTKVGEVKKLQFSEIKKFLMLYSNSRFFKINMRLSILAISILEK